MDVCVIDYGHVQTALLSSMSNIEPSALDGAQDKVIPLLMVNAEICPFNCVLFNFLSVVATGMEMWLSMLATPATQNITIAFSITSAL